MGTTADREEEEAKEGATPRRGSDGFDDDDDGDDGDDGLFDRHPPLGGPVSRDLRSLAFPSSQT